MISAHGCIIMCIIADLKDAVTSFTFFFSPQIQHRSWKSNAVAIATPHIHFGFMGCMPSAPIAWPKHSS